jgi:hypothetical protein
MLRTMLRTLCLGLPLSMICPFFVVAAPQPQSDLESRRKALDSLLAEQWEYNLRTNPLFASILGDKRWNDKVDDFSQEFIDRDLQETQKFLVRFQAIRWVSRAGRAKQGSDGARSANEFGTGTLQGLGDAGGTKQRHSN